MSDFYRRDRSSGGRDSGRGFGRRDSGRRSFSGGSDRRRPMEMFKAVCDNCGRDCEVPFRPSNDKPIYCDDCFSKKNREGGQTRERRNDDGGSRSGNGSNPLAKQISDLGTKLDRIIALLEKTPKAQQDKETKQVEQTDSAVSEKTTSPKVKKEKKKKEITEEEK